MRKTRKTLKTFVTMMMLMLTLMLALSVTASAASKVKLNKTKVTLTVKKSCTLKVSGTKKEVKWSTSSQKVATVNSKGKVTARKKGKATITAKIGKKKYTCKVTVKNPLKKLVTSIKLNKATVTLKGKGQTVTLKATVEPTNAYNKAVIWKSSNTRVAKINSKGKVTAVSTGTATITATAKDGSKKKATCKITVKKSTTATKPEHTHKWEKETTKMWMDIERVLDGYYWMPELNSEDCVKVADEERLAVLKSIETYNEQCRAGAWDEPAWFPRLYPELASHYPPARTVYDCVRCRTAGKPVSEYRFMSLEEHMEHMMQAVPVDAPAEEQHAPYDNHDQLYVTIIIRQKCSCGLTKSAFD